MERSCFELTTRRMRPWQASTTTSDQLSVSRQNLVPLIVPAVINDYLKAIRFPTGTPIDTKANEIADSVAFSLEAMGGISDCLLVEHLTQWRLR